MIRIGRNCQKNSVCMALVVVLSLFGGALECSAPSHLLDVSQFRDVPDHQEAFADETGDLSLIVEIDQRQSNVDDQHIGRHFWNDLAEANKSTANSVVFDGLAKTLPSCPNLPPTGLFTNAAVVVGRQCISKFKADAEEAKPVNICIAVYRLPDHNADILLTLQRTCESPSTNGEIDELVQCFLTTAASLHIKDYKIFT
eukprot:GHVS01043270.1.p1 GENE.GHVS01043270.1~~GHVS01043270.1.p1  ORF type:complete len:199 (+),score=26.48 GHVS01043270.1:58-654(+)